MVPLTTIHFFAQFEMRRDDHIVSVPRAARILLAYLTANTGKKINRREIADTVFEESADPRGNLRTGLKQLRDALHVGENGSVYLHATDEYLALYDSPDEIQSDLRRFLRASREADLQETIDVVKMCRGDFLPEVTDNRWVSNFRVEIDSRRTEMSHRLLDELHRHERWQDLTQWAQHSISDDRAYEKAYEKLLIASQALHGHAAIEPIYQQYMDQVERLGVRASPLMTDLYNKLRRAPSAPIFEPKPTPPASNQTRTLPTNLPNLPRKIIGRERDLSDLRNLLLDPECQLISVIGIGGIGKTTLALEATSQMLKETELFPDGVFFVTLDAITSEQGLWTSIADSIRLTFSIQENPKRRLMNYLREKKMLFVFDGFEHLSTSGIDGAGFLEELFNLARNIKVLATTREHISLRREFPLELDGLPVAPDVNDDTLDSYASVQLFVSVAKRLNRRFDFDAEKSAIARICLLTGGMPLAIEMAAAWVQSLTCKDIAARLEQGSDLLVTKMRDVPKRHRSIDAVIRYSWDMLSDEEQRAFNSLCVFPDGFSLDAANKVSGATVNVLDRFSDKSFVRRNAVGRFRCHDLIRQFGQERLRENNEDAKAALAMSLYLLEFARSHAMQYAELEPEWRNFLAAMCLTRDHKEWALVVQLGEALREAWFTRARFADARQGLTLACEAAEQLGDLHTLATHLRWLGRTCNEQSDYANAKIHLQKSLELFKALDDDIGIASALQEEGWTLVELGEHELAEAHFRDSLDIRRRANDTAGIAENLIWLARLNYRFEKDEDAEKLAREALHIQQKGDDKRAIIITLRFLALACNSLKRFDEAKIYGEQALNLSREIDNIGEIYSSMYTLSQILRMTGDLVAAKKMAYESAAHFHLMGDQKSEAHATLQFSQLCVDLQEYDEALISVDRTIYLYDELVEQWWMVRAGMLKGDCLYHLNRKNEAAQIWLQTSKLAKDMNHPLADALNERLGSPGMDEVK